MSLRATPSSPDGTDAAIGASSHQQSDAELLNESVRPEDARAKIADWVADYSLQRSHSLL
ncbi:hypothetical protein QA641_36825 [Bradyrhizobium sp. CB1650]|uniref:hypothetical protein n=1 Tax=Bradyrhizobium sp. CB1650 TaxID=3039153 RepID=UPI0024353A62|nr:hypothetical protein [Bradyrhizobium sp. CB1650]WGD51064.1 hypothetical protein QA641_36825 [Bradyrhizobium sp. CB1650]